MNKKNVIVIGGGAAGFFAAISCKAHHPDHRVTIFEKSDKLLAKVKVSGGGRCNVTHACFSNAELAKFYPRGGKQLKKAFAQFTTTDTIKWFEARGVKLKTEEDNRIFPVTDNSQTVIDCLLGEVDKLGIKIEMHGQISSIEKADQGFIIKLQDKTIHADKVIAASGGLPKREGFEWLEKLGHKIEPPVPSLFTFNMPNEPIKILMGVSVDNAIVRIVGTKLQSEGPLIITHWGMSGPAILKLSAWGARILNGMDYRFNIQVNWIGEANEDKVREAFALERQTNPMRTVGNCESFKLPNRLFQFLLSKVEIDPEATLERLGKKNMNRLINILLNDEYRVEGKTTFKEEFVTCGGVSLDDVNMDTMESRVCPGLYFAGEVLDIDGVTGGFNFQAAWTTAHIAGKLVH